MGAGEALLLKLDLLKGIKGNGEKKKEAQKVPREQRAGPVVVAAAVFVREEWECLKCNTVNPGNQTQMCRSCNTSRKYR